MDYIHHYASPLGPLTLASDGEALTGLWFDGQKHFAAALGPAREEKPLPIFDAADRWLDTYFSGRAPDSTPELRLTGTAFRQAVWRALLAVPFGRTVTYGEIASRLAGEPGTGRASARAVGGAVARNPISLIGPCHRVVGADGGLTGYAGGVERKARLLQMEREGLPR